MDFCLPIFGWGLDPEWEPRAQAKKLEENPRSVLEVRTGGQHGGGGYTSLVLPFPLPRGTTRHAAAYHPCQPSPPGNVAAFSATPSGVPAAPQNTAAGGGEGAAGQVPTPEPGGRGRSPSPKVLEDLRWDRGLGKGVAGVLMLQEEASSIPN